MEFKNKQLDKKRFAFNVWSVSSAKAVIDGAVELNMPIFLQVSSKLFYDIDPKEFIFTIKNYISNKNTDVLITLDHSRDFDIIFKAIEYGWDAVMYDGSHLPIDDNIKNTLKVVEFARKHNVFVEGEIGQVKGVEDDIVVDEESTVTIEEVIRFVKETNVDLLAVGIGTAHGQYGSKEPNIDYNLLNQVCKEIKTPFVVHGGSELPNETLKKLWNYESVKKINISTDLKQAYRLGILEAENNGVLKEKGFDALKVERLIYESIKKVTLSKLNVLKEL